MERKELLRQLAERTLHITLTHPLRVAVDGADASGKTSLANELAEELKLCGRQIIRISIDGFHNSKSVRYSKGRNSAEGYYRDSFNNQSLIENVLQPLGPSGSFMYKKAVFDFRINSAVASPTEHAKRDAIVIVDGIFLFRPELIEYWDFKIFLEVDFEIAIARATKRDGHLLGSKNKIISKYNERYIPGQMLYFKESRPLETADVIIDNNNPNNPIIKKMGSVGTPEV